MINPVFRRETRSLLRSWKTFAVLTVYVTLLAVVGAISIAVINVSMSYSSGFDPQAVIGLFYILSGFQNIIIAIIVPALTGGAISGERERQTLDLMLLTKMSTFSIITGKLMSSLLTILLMVLASLPVFSVVFYYGGVSLFHLFTMTAYTILFAAMVGSIAIFFSTFTKKTIVSTVWTYVVLLFFTFGNLFINSIISVLIPSNRLSEEMALLFFKFLFSINPGVAFFSIVESQIGLNIINDFFNSLIYNSYYYGSTMSYSSLFQTLNAIPMWVFNVVWLVAITLFAILLSTRLVKPVK